MMAAPLKVGILNDMSDGPSDIPSVEPWLRLAADELVACGRLDRDVDFVHSWGLGLPTGTAAAVERAYTELVDQGVLMIVGPAIGDNALVATPLADRYRIPAINWAGTERARSEFMFHLQVGSHEDETVLLAQHLHSLGVRRVGVVHDRAPIARRYLQFFRNEADITGLRVAAMAPIAELTEDAGPEVGEVLAAGVEAFVYLGLGLSARAVGRSVASSGWDGPRVMNTAGMRGYDPAFAREIDGWAYIDMHSDGNRTLTSLLQRPQLPSTDGSSAARGYDLGRLVAEGLARAPERTRKGVKEGLEQIKWLSAAEGKDGTLLGFGQQDRGALHGRYLVLRRWEAGSSVEV